MRAETQEVMYRGVWWCYRPEHPAANRYGYVQRDRLAIEDRSGRVLGSRDIVVHIDGDPLNDDPSNLVVLDRRQGQRLSRMIAHEFREFLERCAMESRWEEHIRERVAEWLEQLKPRILPEEMKR